MVWDKILMIWNEMLGFHANILPSLDLIKDLVFIAGAYYVIRFLKNYSFDKRRKEIQDNLAMRSRIEKHLIEFLEDKQKETKRTRLCFMCWKNYPWNFDDGKYGKEYGELPLYFNRTKMENRPCDFSSNTGIYIEEPIMFYGTSLYVSKKHKTNICFLAKKGKKIHGFEEWEPRAFVREIPYKNIINFDFQERLEYSPLIYTKYKHKSKKLFSKDFYITNLSVGNEQLFKLGGLINGYWSPKHLWLLIKANILIKDK